MVPSESRLLQGVFCKIPFFLVWSCSPSVSFPCLLAVSAAKEREFLFLPALAQLFSFYGSFGCLLSGSMYSRKNCPPEFALHSGTVGPARRDPVGCSGMVTTTPSVLVGRLLVVCWLG